MIEKKRDPRVRKFVDYAYQTYREKYGQRLVITGADTANTKRVLITVELERLKQYWDWYLHYSGDDWQLKTATRDIKTFCGHINRIVQQCRIKPEITTTSPLGEDTVYAETATSERADELFSTFDPSEREKRIAEIEQRLVKTHPGWDRKTYRNTAIAILKGNLIDKSGV